MCEVFDSCSPRYTLVACATAIKTKNYREKRKRGYEVQIEKPYPVEKLQRTRGPIQVNEQINSQVEVLESPKKIQE